MLDDEIPFTTIGLGIYSIRTPHAVVCNDRPLGGVEDGFCAVRKDVRASNPFLDTTPPALVVPPKRQRTKQQLEQKKLRNAPAVHQPVAVRDLLLLCILLDGKNSVLIRRLVVIRSPVVVKGAMARETMSFASFWSVALHHQLPIVGAEAQVIGGEVLRSS